MSKTAKDAPLHSSSSSSDEESGSESESSGSEEEESESTNIQPSSVVKTTQKQESESESDESDESEEKEAPITKKVVVEEQEVLSTKTQQSSVKTTQEEPESSESDEEEERKSDEEEEESDEEESEKEEIPPKKEEEPETSNKTKNNGGMFERKFSFEDEINLLKAMAELKKSENDGGGKIDVRKFYESIKNSLSFEPTYSHLTNKIKVLEMKYLDLAGHVARGEKLPANEHARNVYEFGEKLWGDEKRMNVFIKGEGEKQTMNHHPCFDVAVEKLMKRKRSLVMEKLEAVDEKSVMVMEERLKKQRRAEANIRMQNLILLKDTFKVVMEGIEISEKS